MSADEEKMRSILLTDINRRILRFCKSSHTSAEIVHHVTPSTTTDPAYYETLASNSLKILESLGMISFSDGKWISKNEALLVLAKYFGG